MTRKNYRGPLKKSALYEQAVWIYYAFLADYLNLNKTPSSGLEKRRLVLNIAKSKNFNNFVETGTYLGEMVNEIKDKFKKVYSIEIDKKLYSKAKRRFKKYKHIRIVKGDSCERLAKIINKLEGPTIYWLDAHYSGGITSFGNRQTPVRGELSEILQNWKKDSIILIDDARRFNGKKGYPSLQEIGKIAEKNNLKVLIAHDVIQIS